MSREGIEPSTHSLKARLRSVQLCEPMCEYPMKTSLYKELRDSAVIASVFVCSEEVTNRVTVNNRALLILLENLSVTKTGSSHKSVHDIRQREIAETMVEISNVGRRGTKSIGFVDDEFGLVVQSLDRSVVDRHSKIVHDVVLVSP